MEFALVFPLLFALFYATIVYAYLFALQESVSYAAQESAAAAHRVEPAGMEQAAFESQVEILVRCRAAQALDWLPASQLTSGLSGLSVDNCASSSNGGDSVDVSWTGNDVFTVQLSFDTSGLFPSISMPVIGAIPPIPDQLVGSGTALLGEL